MNNTGIYETVSNIIINCYMALGKINDQIHTIHTDYVNYIK